MTEEQTVDLTEHTKKLGMRLVGSLVLFAIFLALGVADVFVENEMLKYSVVGVFLASFLLLPRETFPRGLKNAQVSASDMEILNKLRLKLSYTRVAYFLACLFILFGLPKIL